MRRVNDVLTIMLNTWFRRYAKPCTRTLIRVGSCVFVDAENHKHTIHEITLNLTNPDLISANVRSSQGAIESHRLFAKQLREEDVTAYCSLPVLCNRHFAL